MRPVRAAEGWALPPLATPRALATWLGVEPPHLSWFADRKGWTTPSFAGEGDERLRHYRYRLLTKEGGGVRVIESPKPLLKALQRKILAEILDLIPAHAAVHGFVKGRSIRSFAAPHVGTPVVLRMDLKDFFPSIGAAKVQAMLRTAGYPEQAAALLAGLCTSVVPGAVWRGATMIPSETRDLYRRPHLPQGAPTSPALANLCSYRVDCRLSGLATKAGAIYTRYADDLAFSGDEQFARDAERFGVQVAAILLEEGLSVNHRKTRLMRQGVRQYLAGIVVNQRLNVVRADFDLLKATLTNCVRFGPTSQNREGIPWFRAHLEGRIGFVASVHPGKGARLRSIFERIRWDVQNEPSQS